MFSASKLSALLLLIPFAVAAPAAERSEFTTFCGQFDTDASGNYELLLDQWGLADATSGSDCASITSTDGETIAWTTTWTFTGGTTVKSFTDMQLNTGVNQQLSAISTIPTTWNWEQTTTGTVVADIAYDMFTADSAGGTAINEIMIWLANFNAGPISAEFDAEGQAVPIASDISLSGQTWNLYSGSNGANNVFSFLPATSGVTIPSFSGDIMEFFTYLIDNEGVSSSQFLTTLQAGTEATSGSATLTTTAYSVAIN
jgi:xyloglucan-specific endo-beta-1,4-glucanase